MKKWTKILIAVLSLVMVLSLVGCPGEPDETQPQDTPQETPKATEPQDTDPVESDTDPVESDTDPTTPPETDPITPPATEIDITEAMQGFVVGEGDIVDGKPLAETGFIGTSKWTGTDLEGYAIMSDIAGKADTKAGVRISIALKEDAFVSFKLKVDSAEGDVFYVVVDKDRIGMADYQAGEYDVKLGVPAGEHTITLFYQKDSSDDAGADAAYVSKFSVTPAGDALKVEELTMDLDKPAEFAAADEIEVEDNAIVMNGASKSTIDTRNFVYIKKSHSYPRVTVSFEVAEAGTYEFLLGICAKSRAEGILSNGLVQIDDGPKYYTGSYHGDRNGVLEYFSGISQELTAGTHQIHFYLAPDFNDDTVKSIYYDFFSFIKA